ncbi:MAG: Lrp/AsnC family transcriptional regulator [Thermoprotei archaeon]
MEEAGAKPNTVGIDELDAEIIRSLQENARMSYRALSRKLGVSVTTISERVRRMIAGGLIRGFTAIVNPEKLGGVYCVTLYIKAAEGVEAKRVGDAVAKIRGVCYVYTTLGLYDVVAMGSAPTKQALSEMIATVNALPEVGEVVPSMILDVVKEEPKHPVYIQTPMTKN